jgi:uncharacterized protein (TIGR04255 family)
LESSHPASVEDRVTFATPPVNEVALSVQFQSPVLDDVGLLADYWPAIRADFPRHEKQPPLPPMQEDFARPPQSGFQFQLLQAPPQPRYWFLSTDGVTLVQVQSDRFALNWRQQKGDEEYPRYRVLRPEFERRYDAFLDVARAGGVQPEPTWCELTYINHVDAPGAAEGAHGPLARVLRALSRDPASSTLPPVEDTALQQRFLLLTEEGEPVGRLYLAATPAFRNEDGAPIYVLTLVVRGRPAEPTMQGVLRFFDRGRDLIVQGFKESTTDEMHKVWGLVESET